MRLANAVILRLLLLLVVSGAVVFTVETWGDWDSGFRTALLVFAVVVCLLVMLSELVSAVVDWRSGGDGFKDHG